MSDKSENEFQFSLNTLLQTIQGTGRWGWSMVTLCTFSTISLLANAGLIFIVQKGSWDLNWR